MDALPQNTKLTQAIIRWSGGMLQTQKQVNWIFVIAILCVVAAAFMILSYSQKENPTTMFTVSPEESIGSPQGLPPSQ